MRPPLALVATMLLAACAGPALSASGTQDIEARAHTFRALLAELPQPDAAEIHKQYEQAFPEPPTKSADLPSTALAAWHGAAYEACFYTANPRPARDLLGLVSELQARDLATASQWAETYDCLISARLTSEAAKVHAAREGEQMGTLPRFASSPELPDGLPSLWRVDTAAGTLYREPVDLRGPRIVVVAHPHCGFCRRAVHAIESDAQLQPLMAQHAIWLAPAAGSFAFDAVLAWNREHPHAALAYAWREQDWPMIQQWATPTFLFLREGILQQRIQGWPAEGRAVEILSAAAAIGIRSGPKRTFREELEAIYVLDQKYRSPDGGYTWSEVAAEQDALDNANLAAVLRLVDAHGWPRISEVGEEAALAAFLVVQHAELGVQERFWPVIRDLVAEGEAKGAWLALLTDRIRIRKGLPQVYGTQTRFDAQLGRSAPLPIEDPEHVNERRVAVGLKPLRGPVRANQPSGTAASAR